MYFYQILLHQSLLK